MLYLVCAVKKPTKNAQEAGEVEEVVGPVTAICADTESGAIAQFTSDVLGEWKKKDLRQVEVLVRPFK